MSDFLDLSEPKGSPSARLKATKTLLAMAAQKPRQVKLISAVLLKTMPAITKSNENQALREVRWPMSSAVKSAVKKGSAAFTVCTKLMCTSETEMLLKSMPHQWSSARPRSFR